MAMIIRPLDEEVEVGISRLSFMMMLSEMVVDYELLPAYYIIRYMNKSATNDA